MTVLAQPLQVFETALCRGQPLIDEAVCSLQFIGLRKEGLVERIDIVAQQGEFLPPAALVLAAGEERIDTGASGLLVFKQAISDAGVSGNNENAAVGGIPRTGQNNVIAHRLVVQHGRTADFFDSVGIHGSPYSSRSS